MTDPRPKPTMTQTTDDGPMMLCPACAGTGRIQEMDGFEMSSAACEKCGGPGIIRRKPETPAIVAECWTCAGHTADPRTGRFTVPYRPQLSRVTADTHRAAGHDVRPVTQKGAGS